MGTAWGDSSNCLSERMKSESIPSLKSAVIVYSSLLSCPSTTTVTGGPDLQISRQALHLLLRGQTAMGSKKAKVCSSLLRTWVQAQKLFSAAKCKMHYQNKVILWHLLVLLGGYQDSFDKPAFCLRLSMAVGQEGRTPGLLLLFPAVPRNPLLDSGSYRHGQFLPLQEEDTASTQQSPLCKPPVHQDKEL